MSYTPSYTKKTFVNGQAPAINASNLNDIEDALISLGNNAQTDSSRVDTLVTNVGTLQTEIATKASASDLSAEVTARTNADTQINRDLTNLSARTTRTEKSLDYLWKKSKGIVYDTETVTSYAKEVSVPSGAMEYASLDMLGGMSRKCKNLCTNNTQTFTPRWVGDQFFECALTVGKTYKISFVSDTSVNLGFLLRPLTTNVVVGLNTFEITVVNTTNNMFYLNDHSFAIGNSFTFSEIMITEDLNATYEPYTSSLIDAKCDKVVSFGRNIWNGSGYVDKYWSDNGVLTVIGGNSCTEKLAITPSTVYSISATSAERTVKFFTESMTLISKRDIASNATCTITSPSNAKYMISNIGSSVLEQFSINQGNDTEYSAYHTPIEKSLPTSITSLDGYGIGINSSCFNYLEFVNDKVYFHKKVGSVDLGSLNWQYYEYHNRMYAELYGAKKHNESSRDVALNVLCTLYKTVSFNELDNSTENNVVAVSDASGQPYEWLTTRDSRFTDANTYKTSISGTVLLYELETESVTDVTSYFTEDWEILQTESNGKIQFHYSAIDTYDVGVPSTVTYMIDVDEV